MASFTWQSLIDRAKTYVDDDHDDERSWISDERWLQIANVEYALLYKRWIRSGLVTPTITQSYMSDSTRTFAGVLAVVGVAKDYGDFVRLLNNAAQSASNQPFWRGSTQPSDLAVSWAATGVGDSLTIELDPEPSDLEYTAAAAAEKATLDIGAPLTGMGTACETVLRMKTGGVANVTLQNFSGIVTHPAERYIQYVPAEYSNTGTEEYGFIIWDTDGDPFTNQDFEALIAANECLVGAGPNVGQTAELPFEVMTASSSTTDWRPNITLISTTLAYTVYPTQSTELIFEGGADAIAESGNYVVRYVPTVAYATDASTTIELPYGADERLVLGMARRAHLKDSGASALLERLIMEADAETGFSAASKAGGIIVKRKPKRSPLSTPRPIIWPERSAWLYI